MFTDSLKSLAILAASLALSACGGGSGSNGDTVATKQPATQAPLTDTSTDDASSDPQTRAPTDMAVMDQSNARELADDYENLLVLSLDWIDPYVSGRHLHDHSSL